MLLMRRKSNFLDLKGTEHAHAMAFSRVNECMKNKRRAALELRRGDKLESRLSLDHLTHVEDNVISKFLRIWTSEAVVWPPKRPQDAKCDLGFEISDLKSP